jgi:hypothetical protein
MVAQRSTLADFKPVPDDRVRRPSVSVSVASTSAITTSATHVDGEADDEADEADGDSAEPSYVGTQFWNYVDDQLAKVQEEAKRASPTEEGQAKWMNA